MSVFISDRFGLSPELLEKYGALDGSLVADLPFFIDPFLLFNSKKPEYQALHKSIIGYLVFLRDKAQSGNVDEALLRAWYCFPEVKQTWLGFSLEGNDGRGLGIDFARALHSNLDKLFGEFGAEKITKGMGAIHFRVLLIWPLWAGAAGITAIALGALIEVKRDYSPSEIDLFAWARNKQEQEERKERIKKAYDETLARRQYYKEHPDKIPPHMPNPNTNITKYIA
jgi:hypothetical protein